MKALPEDVMKQILDEHRPEQLQPGDITSEIAMKAWKASRGGSLLKLNKLVDEGVLEKKKYKTEGGKMAWLFRPIIK